jgi:two-component system cell cycle response regulator CtrA
MRVLLVESEPTTARAVSLVLKARCSAIVDTVDTGEEALEMVRHYEYDAVVLDLTLPDMDGYDVLRRMRTAQTHAPVLVVTGSSQPHAKVRAFSLGADDVMTKPFDNDELAARIQAIVRRSKGHSQPGLQLGPIHLNLDTREVTVEGQPVQLTPKEYLILQLMVLRKGMVLTKEAFLNHLYGGMDEPEVKIIDVFICKLRKKLASAGAGNVIGTVWGRGYIAREPGVSADRQAAFATAAPHGSTPLAEVLRPAAANLKHKTSGTARAERVLVSA